MNNLWPACSMGWRIGEPYVSLISLIFFVSSETGTVPALK